MLALCFPLFFSQLHAFQVDSPAPTSSVEQLSPYQILEAGRADEKNVPPSVFSLGQGNYQLALDQAMADPKFSGIWLKEYLEGLVEVSAPLERHESKHFILFTPPHQSFLADYALPALEKVGDRYEKLFDFRPQGKIRVEIYPTKEDFSKASTLTLPILENSGAIGICKFHRLMIMSPQSLPLGYRWLDALGHEYAHLMINELSDSHAELWIHEGTARYCETLWRLDPPLYLTPEQKSELKKAQEAGTLVTFARMSPSMVYLKDQAEVSLAFAEVAHAVSVLVKEGSLKKYGQFLRNLQVKSFSESFKGSFKMTPVEFEASWQKTLAAEKWEKTKGAMSDQIRFGGWDESEAIGADVKGRVRLGDKMRMQGLQEAALIEYEKALTEEPDNAIVLLKAARVQLSLGQKEEAIQHLRRAIQKNPNYGTPYVELAPLVDPKESIALYGEANSLNPFDPRIHKGLADAYQKLGRPKDADRESQIAVQLSSK